MEPNFQTSFIPKKPIIEHRAVSARSVGFSTIVSIFILFAVLIASGGLYFYKGVVSKNITDMENALTLAKNRFEPEKITELKTLDRRLNASTEILAHHVAVSPIFQALSALTMKTVRYTDFTYTLGETKADKITVQMKGVAIGYRSIALQSDLFLKNKNIIDPIFSNLNLDDKGNVIFDLNFSVDPTFLDYKSTLQQPAS